MQGCGTCDGLPPATHVVLEMQGTAPSMDPADPGAAGNPSQLNGKAIGLPCQLISVVRLDVHGATLAAGFCLMRFCYMAGHLKLPLQP